MHPVTVNLQVNSRYGDSCWEITKYPCATLLPLVQSGIPARSACGLLLLALATSYSFSVKEWWSCAAGCDGQLGVTCSLLKPCAQDLPEEGIAKGDLFFRTTADSTRVK